jgi:hypothetical protein
MVHPRNVERVDADNLCARPNRPTADLVAVRMEAGVVGSRSLT